ncbi:metal ABC transporter solute-binding protein, Zn/Mn family [Nibricoccus sp. IMCC34717]|uniref:metal ABC transporter solute-binding protein, Zn/Mn family n=1 Tax=Nibricoccus sp. IMCC34717 TaxID=3034021 RepID=UPI00384C7393
MSPLRFIVRAFVFNAGLALLALGVDLRALEVVTSNTLLFDLSRQVALPTDSVTSLVPPGVDPHGYSPTPSDIKRLYGAEVVVVNGLGLEPWLERISRDLPAGRRLVVATDGIVPLQTGHSCGGEGHDHDHDHDHGDADPHAWHDLKNTARYVANIRDGLAAANPEGTAQYAANAEALLARIHSLDTEARTRLGALPKASRRLVTSHDSFAYFGHAYGFEVIAIGGLRPDREPSARQLAALIDRVRELRVRAVFIESTSNPKVPRLLAAEAGVRVVTELYTDSLGPEGTAAGTFLGMFRANLDTLEQSLKE